MNSPQEYLPFPAIDSSPAVIGLQEKHGMNTYQ